MLVAGILSTCVHGRALKAQEAAKKAAQLAERQQGGGDLQSRAPTTTQTKEASPKVAYLIALPLLSTTLASIYPLRGHGCYRNH